eukprot:4277401-Karenia_brevis.AAC.1
MKDTRTIVPLGAILQILDTTIAIISNKNIPKLISAHPSTYIGGRRRTQPIDVAWSLGQVVERGLDSHSCAALAQEDIATHFDAMSMLHIAKMAPFTSCTFMDMYVFVAHSNVALIAAVRG